MGFITRREHAAIVDWLRPLEQALRKLIYLQAVAAPAPPARASTPRTKTKRIRRFIEADSEQPESWRVRFQVLTPASRSAQRASSSQGGLVNAWPAAERFEAVIPLSTIRRLWWAAWRVCCAASPRASRRC